MLRKKTFSFLLIILFLFISVDMLFGTEKNFIGSKKCAECHEKEYKIFSKYAKKAHSFKSIKKMRDGLTEIEIESCYDCHTTGYKKPGGFVSESSTPDLKNAGCEVCHGPGSLHIETEDPDDIIGGDRMTMKMCEKCHSSDRISAFGFKPMLYGGAH